jgi:hypothetical protein
LGCVRVEGRGEVVLVTPFFYKKNMAGLVPIDASLATSVGLDFTGLSGTSNPFDNSGSGITFGNANIGASNLTSSPAQNQTPTFDNPSSAATGGSSGAGTPLAGSSSSSLIIILLVVGAGVAIYYLTKK